MLLRKVALILCSLAIYELTICATPRNKHDKDKLPTVEHRNVVPDISDDPYVFESDRLPTINGTLSLREMPSVANGHLATNLYSDTIYTNGIYTGYGGKSYRARVHSVHARKLHIEGDEEASRRYRLDVRRGVFEEEITGRHARVLHRVYAHNHFNRVLLTDITVQRIGDIGENDTQPITVNFENLSGEQSTDFTWEPEVDEGPYKKLKGVIKEAETEESGLTPVCLYWMSMPNSTTLGTSQSFRRIIYPLAIDQDENVARSHMDEVFMYILLGQLDQLLALHTGNWNHIWENGSIDIEGDLTLQKVISGGLYYLYSNLPSQNPYTANNPFYGLSPGGLANGRNGSDYYGHVFWDMETWMYPGILMFRPDLARDMLQYRINSMDPAFDRAESNGHNGTRFPWESGYTGVEVTPDICPLCRENQQHITGDIAFAARQYVSATRNLTWLKEIQGDQYSGYEFIREMAHFWGTRATWNETKARYEINGVMPPDEHQEEINNSVYTNMMACLAIHFAKYTACLAEVDDTPIEEWEEVAHNLAFLYNSEKRYHEEFEGWDHQMETDTVDPRGVKQADVALLGFPMMWEMPWDVRQNDLEIYEKYTNPMGPAMTWGMYSIGWLDLENEPRANELFNRSYQHYYREPFKIWTEVTDGIGAVNFITGIGGFLQTILFGYGGMRLKVEEFDIRPHYLPDGITKMTFKGIHYLGNKLTVTYVPDEVHIEHVDRFTGAENIVITDDTGKRDVLNEGTAGNKYFYFRGNIKIESVAPSGCDLPKDTINNEYVYISTPAPTPIPTISGAGSNHCIRVLCLSSFSIVLLLRRLL